MQIEQHDRRRPAAFLIGEVVYIMHGVVAILNDFEVVGKFMGSEHPADHVNIHRVIFHNDDGQRRMQCWSLHNGSSSVCAMRTSDMRQGNKSCWYRTLTFVTSIARWKNIFQDREVCLFTPPCNSTPHGFIL